jgi:hypothetical protein
MELFYIKQVYSHSTRTPEVTRWEILASRVVDPFRTRFLSTISNLRASACQRAKELDQPIGLSVEHTQYGDEITSVDMAAPPEARGRVISHAEFFERR